MDKLWGFIFLLQFPSLCFLSCAYTPPDKYFINCGSSANFNDSRRTFVGDVNPNSFSLSPKQTARGVENTANPSSDPLHDLYQTARIFRSQSSYKLDITENGTYWVRFHFFPPELPSLPFDVSASGSNLLQDFTVQTNTNSTVVKEFLLSIDVGEFVIDFKPQKPSFAFVNAIEVFLSPDGFIPNSTWQVSQAGLQSNGDHTGLLSQVLQRVHGINVGGPYITPSGDTLWRQWVPDDPYLYTPTTSFNGSTYTERPKYEDAVMNHAATEYIAPDSVYQSAKININSTSGSNTSTLSNITWGFGVSKNIKHLVRLHFCDVFSTSLNTTLFDLFLYSNYSQIIDPYALSFNNLATPFYYDYVVDSGNSEFMTVSICPRADSDKRMAYLNGLEIMQIMGPRGSIPASGANGASKRAVIVIVGSVIAGVALICILVVAVLLVLKKRRKTKPFEATSVWSAVPLHKEGSSNATTSSHVVNLNLSLRISFAELQSATKNFNKKLIIGKGGFGNVYSGKLSNGTKVAVKRSELGSGQGLYEFHTEINVLSKIRHRHLVSLIGYCDEGPEMILVYEFMEKGTLREHLYASKFPCLSWKQRLDICIGAAKGLLYLHKGSAGAIIHRDVKSTNILLDENHLAKVADFGLSKLASLDETHVSTGVKGTFGYLDPDYFRSNQLTEKSDVYSFGVVLLEVLCARSPLDRSLPRDQVNLADWALHCKQNGQLEQIVDPRIKDEINPNSLRKFGEIAERCVQEYGSNRPTMSDVLWDLEYALQLHPSAARNAEPLEDSAMDCSSAFAMPIQRFPSMSLSFAGDDSVIAREDGSVTSASEVFSQLKADDAR